MQLPKRLARRLLDLQLLPYIVVTNPHILQVYQSYRHAFDILRDYKTPQTMSENEKFSSLLRRLVDEHAPMLDALANGLREIKRKPLVGPHLQLDSFLEAMLSSRISRRVLAEHHINLNNSRPGYIGIICTDLSLADSIDFAAGRSKQVCIETYGSAPEILISGDVHLRVPYIPAHLDYMLYELLKNASRAVVERHLRQRKEKSIYIYNSASSSSISGDDEFRNTPGGGGINSGSTGGTSGYEEGSSSSSSTGDDDSFSPTNNFSQQQLEGSHFSSSSPSLLSDVRFPPIHVRICGGTDDVTLRISDQGGGIPFHLIKKVWEFGWTDLDVVQSTVEEQGQESREEIRRIKNSKDSGKIKSEEGLRREGLGLDSTIPGTGAIDFNIPTSTVPGSGRFRMADLGFGLPLSRLYARYFGGDLRLVSMPGYGVDAFLYLKGLVAEGKRDWAEQGASNSNEVHGSIRGNSVGEKMNSGGRDGGGDAVPRDVEGIGSLNVSPSGVNIF